MIELSEPYAPRPIAFLGLEEIASWRLKLYGIVYRGASPRAELVDAARRLAAREVAALEPQGYQVGFFGVHDGRGSNFVFLDWWAEENELHHRVFVSPSASPENLEERTGSGLLACVWDLRVICFEREAWRARVLCNPRGPDLEGYLGCTLNECS